MASNEKRVYGYVEKILLLEKNLILSAKLDTGAKSASLNATSIQQIEIDGKPYLRFIVPSRHGDILFTAEYAGEVNIKIHAGTKPIPSVSRKTTVRPVVLMQIKIADQIRTIRVNLTNRKRFIYPLLLGREALVSLNGIVDPSRKYTFKINSKNSS